MDRVHQGVLDLLSEVGLSGATDSMIRTLEKRGGFVDEYGFLRFPKSLVEDAIAGFRRDLVLHGSVPGHELDLSGTRVHMGSGGAAPEMIDLDTGQYRPSTLIDLYQCARVVNELENIHFFSRSVTARDMDTSLDLDVNTAYACLKGTSKHVASSVTVGDNVAEVVRLCHAIAGGKKAFDERPFLSLNINHVVPPLRFSEDSCDVMEQAARLGLPFFVNSFDQAGASSPVSLLGSVVQCTAECLAGMVFSWLVNPDCMAIFGPRPLVTDLRTGALTGGGGEHAVVTAAGSQMGRYYDLPCSCIAGATDSKVPDAQSGFEKALSITLAAHAGCNLITQASGMHAAMMGCSLESYVIDNDMLGAVLRSVRGLEASSQEFSTDNFRQVVHGEGHFLGLPETMARMNSDFLYPEVSDRRTAAQWEEEGSPDIRETANRQVREILNREPPAHLPELVDKQLREEFRIFL